jgi:hypothetical protein
MSVVVLVLFMEKYLSDFIQFNLVEVEIKPTLSPKNLINLLANYVRENIYFIKRKKLNKVLR